MAIRSMNPRLAAVVGLAVIAALLVAGLRASHLPLINPARVSYSAQFTDAGGLQAGDAVQVAGVVVGRVQGIAVETNLVLVRFNVDRGTDFGTGTTAAIKVGSLLGSKYLELQPAGSGQLAPHSVIPVSRTKAAYDVATAFGDLTHVEESLDTTTIERALDALSGAFRTSPPQMRAAVQGLSDLSHTIASRDGQFRELVGHAAATSAVLDQRRGDLVAILKATDQVLAALQQRKAVIDQLLKTTVSLTTQLRGLVNEDRPTLKPALSQLASVTSMLEQHQGDIASTIANLNNYVKTFNNVVGTGPWFDVVIPRLPNSVSVEKR